MKFSIAFVISALAAFLLGLYLPWWGIALAGFAAGLIVPQHSFRSFFSAFAGVFFLWGGMALWIDLQNQQILSGRLSHLFPLAGQGWALILLTAFLGGLVAGLASWSSTLFHQWLRNR